MNLTQEKFKALQIPLPPVDEQQEIVRRAGALTGSERGIQGRLDKAGNLLDAAVEAAWRRALSQPSVAAREA
jgi:hypothetical protein